jgi:processive 1,2-diacylglycerol beta-glucosyltransferase
MSMLYNCKETYVTGGNMAKNILIISSNFTGHGHKSITEALCEQFSKLEGVNVHVIDGFSLGGNVLLRIGKLYGSVTRNAKELWKLLWEISLKRPSLINEFIEIIIRDSFLRLLKSVKPDLILSVHPNFNGCILNILEEFDIKIPFVTLLADLVSIAPLWSDPRADFIICPTQESKYKCMEFGVAEAKLKVIGFPIRAKFSEHIGNDDEDNSYDPAKPLECLIMSGGEGSGNMSRIARILLKNFNCRIRIIAGRNTVLKKRLERTLMEEYTDRVKVFGFLENIQEQMRKSDIAFTRGSPNTLLEAVMCNTPLIITGALPGQEEGNPGYMVKHNLGVVCNETRKLKGLVQDLLSNNADKLNRIKNSQREFRNPQIPMEIVQFLTSIPGKGEVIIPEPEIGLRRIVRSQNFMLSPETVRRLLDKRARK